MKSEGARIPVLRPALLAATCALAIAGCATTTEAPQPRSQIEILEEVGFTITEEATVDNDVRLDYEEALGLLEQGRHDEGVTMLQQVAEEAPELSAPLIDLGIAHHRVGEFEAAEEFLLKAKALNPDHPTTLNELGIVYRKTGRFDEARQSYEAALAVYPGYHHARRNLAILCDLYLADPECALENYEAYMRTVPADKEAEMWIADLRLRLGQ